VIKILEYAAIIIGVIAILPLTWWLADQFGDDGADV
jgi:hypothetical protein